MTTTEEMTAAAKNLSEAELQLAVNQAFGVVSDELIGKAEKLVKSFRNGLAREDASRSPLKGALLLAGRADSGKKAIQNYLHYQLGRRHSGDIWRVKGERGENFAVGLSKQLDELEPIVQKIAQLVESTTGVQLSAEQQSAARMRVIQLFLGYVVRAHVAVSGRTKH